MAELSRDLFTDLATAFAAESTAVQRFTYFAEVARIEGHLAVAALLGELADSLNCVAHGHIDIFQQVADPTTDRPIGDTSLNLAAALTGELRTASELYPRLAGTARDAGLADVAGWLETLCALKKAHVAKLNLALASLTAQIPDGPDPAAGQTDEGTRE
jgi:rubrerythrin